MSQCLLTHVLILGKLQKQGLALRKTNKLNMYNKIKMTTRPLVPKNPTAFVKLDVYKKGWTRLPR